MRTLGSRHRALVACPRGTWLSTIVSFVRGGTPFAWAVVTATQVALLACAWFACRLLKKRARERVGLFFR